MPTGRWVHRRPCAGGADVRRRRRLGEAVDGSKRPPRGGVDAFDECGADRRAPAGCLGETGQIGARVPGSVAQGDVRGARGHGEGGPPALNGSERFARLEPVQQHDRRAGQDGGTETGDDSGDVEQGRDAEHHIVAVE